MRHFAADSVPAPHSDAPFPHNESGRPVDLEIGCGVGFHPLRLALREPERLVVAIEQTQERFGQFSRRFREHGAPSNLFPVRDDAVRWITHRVPSQSLQNIFILYPNPYPKESQGNKRWHRMPFMSCLLDRLLPEGVLHLATNEKFYAEEARHYMEEVWGLRTLKDKELRRNALDIGPFRTHFERKYLARGQVCYDLAWSRLEPSFED